MLVRVPPGFEAKRILGGQVWLREGLEAALADAGLDSVDSALALAGEQRGRLKSLARLDHAQLGRVFVKRWHFNRFEVWLRGALKLNVPEFSGLRELLNLQALTGAGFRVPVPLAAGRRVQGLRCTSYVALAELPGRPLIETGRPSPALARALGVLVRRLHAAGFAHRDLYLDNVFHDDAQGLGLLDCERVFLSPRGLRRRWVIKDLAALQCSAGPAWSRTDRLRALRAYLRGQRLTPSTRQLARAVLRKAARLTAHGAKGPRAD